MTRDVYDKATVCLDRIAKIDKFIEKLKREFPELEYDMEAKELFNNSVFKTLEAKRMHIKKEFEDL